VLYVLIDEPQISNSHKIKFSLGVNKGILFLRCELAFDNLKGLMIILCVLVPT